MHKEELLTQKWDDKVDDLSYDLEEAILQVLDKRYNGVMNPVDSLQAIALAAGHFVQTIEGLSKCDFFHPFWTWFDYSHTYYEQHPSTPVKHKDL